MKNDQLGKLAEDDAARDAIHIAIAPVIASTFLHPAQPVGLLPSGEAAPHMPNPVGIVDPFLREVVEPGKRFWLCLNPNTITSLRHDWAHPAFSEVLQNREKEIARKVIEDFIETINESMNVDQFVGLMRQRATGGDDYFDGVYFSENFEVPSSIWDCVDLLSGEPIPAGARTGYMSCAC